MPLVSVADVYITDELAQRPAGSVDYLREKLALQDLAYQMAEYPEQVLPRLVSLAMEVCDAASAGISLFEPEQGTAGIFRWHRLVGVLERFNGATTPRDFSPCGICLDQSQTTLAQHPERVYDWIADAGIIVPEVLLVPLRAGRGEALGTLWIVARPGQKFDSSHARVAAELAAFAGLAFRMVETERHLTLALDRQQSLTREMSHRIQNLFAVANSFVSLSERSAQSPKEMSATLFARLNALSRAHAIVRNPSINTAAGIQAYDLKELISAILEPYNTGANVRVSGGRLELAEHSVISVALTLHELATNAAKYGALSSSLGVVTVEWRTEGGDLVLQWGETGGPPITTHPAQSGFGSRLIRAGITQMDGSLAYEWRPQGLKVEIILPIGKLQ